MTLTNRRAGLERRYDGLLFSLALTDPGTDGGGGGGGEGGVGGGGGGADGGGGGKGAAPSLRVVGKVTAWNSTSPNGEGGTLHAEQSSFSMATLRAAGWCAGREGGASSHLACVSR